MHANMTTATDTTRASTGSATAQPVLTTTPETDAVYYQFSPAPLAFALGMMQDHAECMEEQRDAARSALADMLKTALKVDDKAWASAIERAGTVRPCDQAMAALAEVRKGGAQ